MGRQQVGLIVLRTEREEEPAAAAKEAERPEEEIVPHAEEAIHRAAPVMSRSSRGGNAPCAPIVGRRQR